jgi:hypothetical protein
MSNNSPSRKLNRNRYSHVTLRKDPYHNTLHRWAVERSIGNSEMVERLIKTYAALLGEDLKIPEPAEPTKNRYFRTDDYATEETTNTEW